MCLGSQDPEDMPIFAKSSNPLFANPDRQYLHEAMTRDPYLLENAWTFPDLLPVAWEFLTKQMRVQKTETAALIEKAKTLERDRDFVKRLCSSKFKPKGTPLTTEWYVGEMEMDEKKVKGLMREFLGMGGRKEDREAVARLLRRGLGVVREEKKVVAELEHEIEQYLAASA